MPVYSDNGKVRDLFPKLDEIKSLSVKQVDFFIDQAEPIINGKLAVRYTVPFSPVPPLIESLTTEYALLKLLDRFFTQEKPSKSEWREIRKEDLDETLNGLADGSISLVSSAGEIIAQRTDIGGIASDTKDYTPTFSHRTEEGQEVDPDRLDDEEGNLS